MRTALEMLATFGVAVVCIVLGVMALSIFFMILARFASDGTKPDSIAIRGILKKDTWATVHMTGAETFKKVRFLGFTNSEGIKAGLPMDLNGMVILEDEKGTHFLVRAKAIRMIVIAPEGQDSATA